MRETHYRTGKEFFRNLLDEVNSVIQERGRNDDRHSHWVESKSWQKTR